MGQLGIEADFDGADIDGSTTSTVTGQLVDPSTLTRSVEIDSKIDELGSVRGKVGLAAWQNWLIYGTGGLAFAHVQDTATVTQTANFFVPPGNGTASFSGGESMFGWAAGGGIDYKWQIDPGSAVRSHKLPVLHPLSLAKKV